MTLNNNAVCLYKLTSTWPSLVTSVFQKMMKHWNTENAFLGRTNTQELFVSNDEYSMQSQKCFSLFFEVLTEFLWWLLDTCDTCLSVESISAPLLVSTQVQRCFQL